MLQPVAAVATMEPYQYGGKTLLIPTHRDIPFVPPATEPALYRREDWTTSTSCGMTCGSYNGARPVRAGKHRVHGLVILPTSLVATEPALYGREDSAVNAARSA